MDLLLKHLGNIVSTDWQTIAVICVLCGLASYFLKEYLANPPMIVFVYPVLVAFSVVVQYLFTINELFVPKKLDQWLMWTILATICGTVVGTCLVAALASLREGGGRRRA